MPVASKKFLQERLYRRLVAAARREGVSSESDLVARVVGLNGQARELFLAVAEHPRTSDELRREMGVANVAIVRDRINERLRAAGDPRRLVCDRADGRAWVWRIEGGRPDAST